MKIAVGIIASNNPQILRETVTYFSMEHFHLFIHIDEKSDIELFNFLEDYNNVSIIKQRVNIQWGGFTMVKAEILLMYAAVNKENFNYFMLMSDDMIPLQPLEVFFSVLKDEQRWVQAQPNSVASIKSRYESITNFDIPAFNPRTRDSSFLTASDLVSLDKVRTVVASGKFLIKDLYHWSQWKIFSFSAIESVIVSYENDLVMRLSFECSVIPDETYIPTILFSSGFSFLKDFIWTDFKRQPAPYVFDNIEEFKEAISLKYLFIRKVQSVAIAKAQIATLSDRSDIT